MRLNWRELAAVLTAAAVTTRRSLLQTAALQTAHQAELPAARVGAAESSELLVHVSSGDSGAPIHDCSLAVRRGDEQAVDVRGKHATGSVIVRVRGTNKARDSAYFRRKRSTKFSVQCSLRLNGDVNGNDLVVAVEFGRALRLPPGVSLLAMLARRIDPALQLDLKSNRPSIVSPLLCAVEVLQISDQCLGGVAAGLRRHLQLMNTAAAPQIIREHVVALPDGSMTFTDGHKRRCWFHREHRRRQFTFRRDESIAFEFTSTHLDLNTFTLKLGRNAIPVHKCLDGQPMQLKIRTRNGRRVFCVIQMQLVHRKHDAGAKVSGSSDD